MNKPMDELLVFSVNRYLGIKCQQELSVDINVSNSVTIQRVRLHHISKERYLYGTFSNALGGANRFCC